MINYRLIVVVLIMVGSLRSQTTEGRKGATSKSLSDDRKSIAPIADCTGEIVDMSVQLRNCYLKCEGYSEPKQGVSIGIYELTGRGPLIVSCIGMTISQQFTETWSFSTVRGDPQIATWKPSEQECKDSISAHCPSYDCDLRPPGVLPEEFHYASTTVASKKFISLHTAQGVLILDDGREYVTPLNAKVKLLSSSGQGEDESRRYFWKQINEVSSCPFRKVGVYGCDEFDEGDEMFYTCSGGGITVTPRVPQKTIHSSICPGVMLSEEGFVYDVGTGDPSSDKQGRISIGVSSGTAETADTTYLRHKIQQVAKKLDSDLCFTQCEVLALESRVSNKSIQLVRLGHEHYLAMPNHTANYCKPTHGCRLTEPPIFCGSPPRLGIECNGISRLWDPTKPYTVIERICDKPLTVENLTFSLGSVQYNVDHDLTVLKSTLDVHGIYQSEFTRYHNNRMSMTKEDMKELKEGWTASKVPRIGLAQDIEAERVINAPHVAIGEWVKTFVSRIGSVFTSIEAIVGILVIIVAISLTITLISKLTPFLSGVRARSTRGDYGPVSHNTGTGRVNWG